MQILVRLINDHLLIGHKDAYVAKQGGRGFTHLNLIFFPRSTIQWIKELVSNGCRN